MGKRVQKPTEAEIERKRNKRRDAMRRLRAAIKNDPIKYEEVKKKERKRYHERVKCGKIKKIKDLRSLEQKTKRKRWRDYSKNHYDSLKKRKNFSEQLELNTPPSSPQPAVGNIQQLENNNLETPSTSRQSSEGRKKRRRNTNKYKLKIKQLEEKLRSEKKRVGRYKKRLERQKKRFGNT